jgi:hypothetical protein
MANELKKYITDHNKTRKMFGAPPIQFDFLTRGAKQVLRENILGELSPENLSCDGEASLEYIEKRRRFLTDALSELERTPAV